MWTNTMSTSDLEAMDLPAPATVPDAAVIARLANEFFAALPPNAALSTVGLPAAADSVALPATPEFAAALAPENPRAVPVYGAPGSPAYIRHAAELAPLNVAPSFPEASGLFSFPSVPGMQSGPENRGAVPVQGAPPPAYIGNAAEPAPFNVAPSFPLVSGLFSFPSVPGMPPVPDASVVSAPLPATAPAAANFEQPGWAAPAGEKAPAAPQSILDPLALEHLANQFLGALPENAPPPQLPAPGELFSFPSVPSVPGAPLPPGTLAEGMDYASPHLAAPGWPAYSPEAERGSPFDAQLSLPVTSDLFVLPGVPGVQSLPGTPVLPSSPPATLPAAPPEEADLRAQYAAVPLPPATGTAAYSPQASVPPAPSQPGVESFDFRPEMTPDLGRAKRPFDPHLIRRDFPILQERVHGHPLIWLDNAATTQKPNAVIDRLSYFYQHENSNVHRAAHTLAARATDAYESAREKVRRFINASSAREIVFVRGTTEGINLVAQAWGRRNVQKDDEIVITWLEHHANIVPWQQLCAEKGARLRVAPVDDRGEVVLEEYEKLLGPRTRLVAFTQVSNALGTITPAREMVEMAHRHGARVLVDGAQSVAHMRTNVQALDCDFFVFSGHKIFGPTGIGVVYGKADILDNTPPWQGGGSMIVDVTFERTTYQPAPARFEAGTGNIADAVGLGAALDYLDEIGIDAVTGYEQELLRYATAALIAIPGLRLIGTAREKAGVLSFVLDEFRTKDVGVALNQEGIAVRAGHHCAQPILRRFGVESTVRPSLALYNTTEDIDALVAAILRMQAGRRHGKL
jgi:cysteine desulfurase/selenocysteine lyase